MTKFLKWSEVRANVVAEAGGEEAVTEARKRNQACIDGHRLSERRKALGLSQTDMTKKMGVTKSRISQIERGEVSTVDAIARYVPGPRRTHPDLRRVRRRHIHPARHRHPRSLTTSTPTPEYGPAAVAPPSGR